MILYCPLYFLDIANLRVLENTSCTYILWGVGEFGVSGSLVCRETCIQMHSGCSYNRAERASATGTVWPGLDISIPVFKTLQNIFVSILAHTVSF